MSWAGVVMFLIFIWSAMPQAVWAGEFPKNLAFLKGLPVVITGECLFDSNGVGTEHFGPCEVRAGRDSAGGRVFYIMVTTAPDRLDSVQLFTLSARPVDPPKKSRPGYITVVVRGTCSGKELGLDNQIRCEIVVFPDPAEGQRIFLRFIRFPTSIRTQLFEVYRGAIILPEGAPVRQPAREMGGDEALAFGDLIADVEVLPDAALDLPPELGYLRRFRQLGTISCRDPAGRRFGMCHVLLDPETRNHYFLMYRDQLWKVWRVNGADRRFHVLWQAPPRCEKEDECA